MKQSHLLRLAVLLFALVLLVIAQGNKKKPGPQCPEFNCDNNQELNETNTCFEHSADDPVTSIKVQQCLNPEEKCYIDENKFAWATSELQFIPKEERLMRSKSQVFNKITRQQCTSKESTIKNLFNGRKCIYNYQCHSKICDEDTNKCKGRVIGESCSDHVECNNGLACRPSGFWPYHTQCLPLADVGSECKSDFDCKTRNFCWKLKKEDEQSICLEMHSAPDHTQIMWDRKRYPNMTKEGLF